MFRLGQLAVHGLAILLGRNEAGISNRGKIFLHHAVLVFLKRTFPFPSIHRDTMSTFVTCRMLGRYAWKPLAITETFEESHLIAKTAKTDERASSALYSITPFPLSNEFGRVLKNTKYRL